MKAKFKWGIIGPGRIAHKFSDAVQGLDEADVYAIASRSTKNPQELKRAFHAERFYPSYEGLVADPAVDAVYIATPHRFHYENVKLCLEADKPVLCEKPITVNAEQAEELVNLSQAKNVFLMEGLWTRFLPIHEQVRKWLDGGKIGDVRLVYSTLGFIADRDLDDRLLNIDLAGGTVLDLGVYTSALTQWVYRQNPKTISAVGSIGETGVDETVSVSLSFKNGAAAQFTTTFQVHTENEMVITGTKGRITVHANLYNPTRATLEIGEKKKSVKSPFKVNGFEYQIAAAMKAIRSGMLECHQMPHEDTVSNMQVLDEIRRQIGMRYPFE